MSNKNEGLKSIAADSKRKIKAVPKKEPEIGIDTNYSFPDNIINAAEGSSLDMSALEAFTSVSQKRENIYTLIDTMAQDSTIAAILSTYAEDVVETNDKGQIVWCEAKDANIGTFVSYLLSSLNIDKHAYSWAHSLVKYGDIYLRLYRNSDYEEDILFGDVSENTTNTLNESMAHLDDVTEKKKLQEEIRLNLYKDNDHYVHYVELVPNPGEMFELTKFGKTAGYIKAPTRVQSTIDNNTTNAYLQYKLKKDDIDIFPATSFVHACLEDTSSRTPEEANIFLDDKQFKSNKPATTYKVRRGKSLLYDVFKIWRELSLLENSVLLSRVTRSSILRIIQVEVGDMPKSKVKAHLYNIKQLIEQKVAINEGKSAQEYTNPGAADNNVIVAIHEGKGAITSTQIGGEVDPKQLTDVEHFQNKFFGSMRIPKQFFGLTNDAAGFSGGTSLSIISSRYGKAIKQLQNVICQAVTDIINLMLLDKGLNNYINKFVIRMQAPITQEEIDRRANKDNRIRYVGDIMDKLNDLPDPVAKLKILKSLLSSVINDSEVISVLQEQIDVLEAEKEEEVKEKPSTSPEETSKEPSLVEKPTLGTDTDVGDEVIEPTLEAPEEAPEEAPAEAPEGDSYMPNPAELKLDMTQNK